MADGAYLKAKPVASGENHSRSVGVASTTLVRASRWVTRYTVGVATVLAAGILLNATGLLPPSLAALGRPTLLALTLGFAMHEAIIFITLGREPGHARWLRLSATLLLGAFAIARVVESVSRSTHHSFDTFAIPTAVLTLATLADLIQTRRDPATPRLVRIGLGMGTLGCATLTALLLGYEAIPWPAWGVLMGIAVLSLAVAGDCYLRLRRRTAR